VTGEIHAGADYHIPRQWAQRLHQAGWRGVAGFARHDPALAERTVTLFDFAGAHHPSWAPWTVAISNAAAVLASMRAYGYAVEPVPFEIPTTEPA